jgi:hypothetical protein
MEIIFNVNFMKEEMLLVNSNDQKKPVLDDVLSSVRLAVPSSGDIP